MGMGTRGEVLVELAVCVWPNEREPCRCGTGTGIARGEEASNEGDIGTEGRRWCVGGLPCTVDARLRVEGMLVLADGDWAGPGAGIRRGGGEGTDAVSMLGKIDVGV